MSFLRPEVRDGLWRWREVAAGVPIALFGLWLVIGSFGLVYFLGLFVLLFGAGLILVGLPRGRFRTGGGGAGVVDVDERQIIYFGPLSGGAMALEDVASLAVLPGGFWELTATGGATLTIPRNAEGAELLFDAFSALPGLGAGRLVEASRRRVDTRTVIWARPQGRLG